MLKVQNKPNIQGELLQESNSIHLSVVGSIPAWLKGTLVRNGPTTVSVNGEAPNHWFDGLGMLHAFTFDDGKVTYSNKFLKTEAYRTVFEDGSIHYAGFASDPCRSLFKRFLTFFFPGDPELHNANVNVAKYADAYVALTETPLPVRFDKETLDTLGVFEYQDSLLKDNCFESAHPHYDLDRQEIINYLVEYGRHSFYSIWRMKEGSKIRELLAHIPVELPSYMHSFAVTDRYVILTEFPLVVNPMDLIISNKGFINNFHWKPERGTHFRVIRRDTGEEIGNFRADPFFAFHHINAYENGNDIIIDIVTYPDANIITDVGGYTSGGNKVDPEGRQLQVQRFTLTLPQGRIHTETIVKAPMEFPRFNERYEGKAYTFAYVADPRDPNGALTDIRYLSKINMDTKTLITWGEAGTFPGEPIFVPSPDAQSEDDGVILCIVMQPEKNNSFLLVLDAKNMQEIGRAIAPYRIPLGLHARFF